MSSFLNFPCKSLSSQMIHSRKTAIFSGIALTGVLFGVAQIRKWLKNRELKKNNKVLAPQRLVVVTGCDSGLGLTMAMWAFDAGYPVVAGCLHDESEGAQLLKRQAGVESFSETNQDSVDGPRLFVKSLDVTKRESIQEFVKQVAELLESYDLYALVLNAAVMIPGEFFWQTENQQSLQMNVNFWGAVNVTKAFESMLLQYQSRLIVISTDCTEYPLPGLSVYAASKAALEVWAKAFRLEVAKYGVSVVSFQPGSFPAQSRILCGQVKYAEEMKSNLDKKLADFYGTTFDQFHSHYIQNFDQSLPPIQPLMDESLRKSFFTVLESNMKLSTVFKYEDIGQKIFHGLINYLPRAQSDKIILKAMNSPQWTTRDFPSDYSDSDGHSKDENSE